MKFIAFPYNASSPNSNRIACEQDVETLRRFGIQASVLPVQSKHDLVHELEKQQIGAVIFLAVWADDLDVLDVFDRYPDVRFFNIFTCNIGMFGKDNEIRRLIWSANACRKAKNFWIAGTSKPFVDWVSCVFDVNAVFLSDLCYPVSVRESRKEQWKPGTPLKIGSFGVPRLLKNFLTSAAVALEIGKRLQVPMEFHTSFARNEGTKEIYDPIKMLFDACLNAKFVGHSWMSWEDFRLLIGEMDLLLQPSFTEAYSKVTAEGVAEGVSSVVSDVIAWAPDSWKGSADNPSELARVGCSLLADSWTALVDGRKALQECIQSGVEMWRKHLCP